MRNNPLGYLTVSMAQEYDHCPRQYFYEYVQGYKPVLPNANLVFGSIMHEVIAEGLKTGHLFADLFLKRWDKVGELKYTGWATYETLKGTGVNLVKKLLEAEVLTLDVEAIEKSFETELPDGTLFKGTADLIYKVNGERILLDWKTSGSKFLACRPALDDQLTAYSFLAGGIEKVAYGVLLKKKDPEVRFYFSSRKEGDYLDFQLKVAKTSADIEGGFFPKNPSSFQCGMCPFSSFCLGQKEIAEKELRKGPVKDRYADKKPEKVLCPA